MNKHTKNTSKSNMTVKRAFGTLNLLEIYSEYVVQKICKEVQSQIKSHL